MIPQSHFLLSLLNLHISLNKLASTYKVFFPHKPHKMGVDLLCCHLCEREQKTRDSSTLLPKLSRKKFPFSCLLKIQLFWRQLVKKQNDILTKKFFVNSMSIKIFVLGTVFVNESNHEYLCSFFIIIYKMKWTSRHGK